jgi:hypothetical protein
VYYFCNHAKTYCQRTGKRFRERIKQMEDSVNCLARCMRGIRRIAKEAILQDLFSKSMGVSVKYNIFHTLI